MCYINYGQNRGNLREALHRTHTNRFLKMHSEIGVEYHLKCTLERTTAEVLTRRIRKSEKVFGLLKSAKSSAGSSGNSRICARPPCGTEGKSLPSPKTLNLLYKALLNLQKAQFCKTKNLENNEQRKARFCKSRHADQQTSSAGRVHSAAVGVRHVLRASNHHCALNRRDSPPARNNKHSRKIRVG